MYENFIDPQVAILERCQTLWIDIAANQGIPEDLAPVGAPVGYTKAGITKILRFLIEQLTAIRNQPDSEKNPIAIQHISQNFNSYTAPMEGWLQAIPQNPGGILPSFISHLNAMLTQLASAGISFGSGLSHERLASLANEHQRVLTQTSELVGQINELTARRDELISALSEAARLKNEMIANLEAIQVAKTSVESDTALSNTNYQAILRLFTDSEQQMEKLKQMAESVPDFESKRDGVLKDCGLILAEAKERLDAASKVGMAVSFADRVKDYKNPRIGWLVVFVLSLIGISAISFCYILPALENLEGVDRLIRFLSELPITAPLIWLAWFSALRFSQLGRLSEDYSFKVATALALDGYRKQAYDVYPELQQALLEQAIKNFGENPLRFLGKEVNHDVHPVSGVLDAKTTSEFVQTAIKSFLKKE